MRERPPLTDRFARTAEPGIYFDPDRRSCAGFMLRVTPAGARSWCLNYRVRDTDRERRMTIGDIAAWPIAEARKEAAELRRIVDMGGDPLGERQDRRAAPTVTELWERFAAEGLPARSERTQAEYRAMARDHILPALGRMKVAALERADIERLHRRITDAGHSRRANAVKSLLSTVFAAAVDWGYRSDNPCQHVKANVEHRRERYLSDDELDRLMSEVERHRAIGGHWVDSADQIELLVLTGCRRGELLGMAWSQIEGLDGTRPTWVLPSRSTKEGQRTGRNKRLPLSEGAAAVLRRRRDERNAGGRVVRLHHHDFVFRGGNGKAGANRLETDWYILRAAAGIEDVRLHDLRHSFASFAVAEGLSLEIIGKLLGHSKIATTQRYSHLSDAPLREAAEIVAAKIHTGRPRR
jgi:integrase